MSSFLDTSVLVPVFLADHLHHAARIALFITCQPETACCAAHSLAELYSTLTRIPAPHRASPDQAIKCVEKFTARLRLISLDGPATLAAIKNAAFQGIAGGTIYDAKSKSALWSQTDYRRLARTEKNREKETVNSAERIVDELKARVGVHQ